VDLVLLDLKQMDPARHLEMTGLKLEPILRNARRLGTQPIAVWVRTPIIPGCTDSRENVAAIAAFIAGNMPSVQRYDLLAFNNLCVGQYERLGIPFPLKDAPLMRRQDMEDLKAAASEAGAPNVHTSGATRLEE